MALRGLLYRKLKQKMAKSKAKEVKPKEEKKTKGERRIKEEVKQQMEFESIKTKFVSPHPKSEETKIEPNGETIKGSARYWGGHFLYPIKTIELGEIFVTKKFIVFVKYGFLKRPEWTMEIPLTKVEWKKVSQVMEEDGIYNVTCFTIPFRDDKGIRHQPKFSVETSSAREKFSKFLYQKISR